MPRNFDLRVQQEMNKRFGVEPYIYVEIEWTDGTRVAYSDRQINSDANTLPDILSIGSFKTTQEVTGSSDSSSTSITLSDTNGHIKKLLDNHDIHLRPVKVYLGFQGVENKALMFSGVVNSPMKWDERARTLELDVYSELEGTQTGFTMDDGLFPSMLPKDLDQPWPLCFGETCDQPPVSLTSTLKGILGTGQGVPDPTLGERICQARHILCPDLPKDDPYTIKGGPAATIGTGSSSQGFKLTIAPATEDIVIPRTTFVPDQDCLTKRFNEICGLLFQIEEQDKYKKDTLTIIGGNKFPQGKEIGLRIGEVTLRGTMTGESFAVLSMTHPDDTRIENPVCKPIAASYKTTVFGHDVGDALPQTLADCDLPLTSVTEVLGGSGESWEYYGQFEKGNFIWLAPGAEVVLDDYANRINVVSLIPGTVTRVTAFQTIGDTKLLMNVPVGRYSVHETDYGDYEAIEVHIHKPLSSYEGEKWDDEIFVSVVSSVGPNAVDVIEYLTDKYTTYKIDPASFAAVHASLEKYPVGFRLTDRQNALDVIKKIAYQNRCSVFIRQDVMYLTYLSEEPTSLRTLGVSDILMGSFSFNHTTTEDLVTQSNQKWSFANEDFTFSLKHNIGKYGVHEQDYDYFAYNIHELVEKSATFWMIRNSNTWRLVEFKTTIKNLDLDVYDCVTIDIPQFPTTKVVITSTEYDVDSNSVTFKAWTPILSGSKTPYVWAWPASQEATTEFPLPEEVNTVGDGNNLVVVPPSGTTLEADQGASTRPATAGDRFPSDLDDVKPSVDCEGTSNPDLEDVLEPVIGEFNAYDNYVKAQKDSVAFPSGGSQAPSDNGCDKATEPCCEATKHGFSGEQECPYEIKLEYHFVNGVSYTTEVGGGLPDREVCLCGEPGPECDFDVMVECHQFIVKEEALNFYNNHQTKIVPANTETICGKKHLRSIDPDDRIFTSDNEERDSEECFPR